MNEPATGRAEIAHVAEPGDAREDQPKGNRAEEVAEGEARGDERGE